MKKKYSKPRIIIEDFAIAQNIAQNCGMQEEVNIHIQTQILVVHGGMNL